MPLYKRNKEKIFFIHIPKCGGTSARDVLKQNGWERIKEPDSLKNSHVHMLHKFWKHWPEAKDCSNKFTLVRNPADRLASHCEMWIQHMFDQSFKKALDAMEFPEEKWDINFLENFFSPIENYFDKHIPHSKLLNKDQRIARLKKNIEWWGKNVKDLSAPLFLDMHVREYNEQTGKHIEISSFEDVVAEYFKHPVNLKEKESNWFSSPSRNYVSEDTQVYKLEEPEKFLEDLYKKGIISLGSFLAGFPRNNRKRMGFLNQKSKTFNNESAVKKQFLDFYREDYIRFNYELTI